MKLARKDRKFVKSYGSMILKVFVAWPGAGVQ